LTSFLDAGAVDILEKIVDMEIFRRAIERTAPTRPAPSKVETISTLSSFLRDGQVRNFNRQRELLGSNVLDLPAVDLQKAQLRGVDLTHVNLERANLRGANLSEARLTGANLKEADLSDTVLSGSIFDAADLTRANLSGSNMGEAIGLDRAIGLGKATGLDENSTVALNNKGIVLSSVWLFPKVEYSRVLHEYSCMGINYNSVFSGYTIHES